MRILRVEAVPQAAGLRADPDPDVLRRYRVG